jgi:hypothetical protein
MRLWIASLVLVIVVATVTVLSLPIAEASAIQQLDEEVPPGNTVIGDDRPGDIKSGKDRSYGLWAVVAVCLIGAGVLLIKVERWEARRIDHADT